MTKNIIGKRIEKVVALNLEDARQLVKIFRDSGDKENLERALADLHKWEQKSEQLSN